MKLRFLAENCVGCRLCELICSATHAKKFNPGKSAILVQDLFPKPGAFKANFCIQCDEHPCLDVCPVEAFKKTELGIYIVDKTICNGCGVCVAACPHQGIWLDPSESYAIKCDLCNGKPECVEICPKNALSLTR